MFQCIWRKSAIYYTCTIYVCCSSLLALIFISNFRNASLLLWSFPLALYLKDEGLHFFSITYIYLFIFSLVKKTIIFLYYWKTSLPLSFYFVLGYIKPSSFSSHSVIKNFAKNLINQSRTKQFGAISTIHMLQKHVLLSIRHLARFDLL